MDPTAEQTLQRAVQQHRAGNLRQSQELYQRVLELEPDQPDALHLLGVVLNQLGDSAKSLDHLRRAIELQPANATLCANLGLVLRGAGKLEESAETYQRAIELEPGFADAHYNLGRTRKLQNRVEEAMECYRAAIGLRPNFAEALNSLGLALLEQDRHQESIDCFQRAIRINPKFVQTVLNLAAAYGKQGDEAAALECCRQAVELDPTCADAHCFLGNRQREMGRFAEAESCYRRALELQPSHTQSLLNLAVTCKDQRRFSESIDYYRQASADPNCVEAIRGLADALSERGHLDQAARQYERLLSMQPDSPLVQLRLASLCPTVFPDAQSIATYREDLSNKLAALEAIPLSVDLQQLDASNCQPAFNLAFHGLDERPIRESYARIFDGPLRDACPRPDPAGSPRGNRLGFVVTRRHEETFCRSMGGVIDRLNRQRFEVLVLCASSGESKIRRSLKNVDTRIVSFPPRLDQIEARIRDSRCDLLYFWEVGSDSTNYFLPYLRLAPIQCTSWGIQVTSGIPAIDYYLSSRLVEAEGAEADYTEQLILADTLLTYQLRGQLPPGGKTRDDFALDAREHVYVCAQHLGKFHPDFDPIIADILNQDSQGVLVIKEELAADTSTAPLLDRLSRSIPDAAERIRVVPHQSRHDYLALVRSADVLLDPIHFGGVNSTYDNLSLNQPTVTLPSRFQRGRYTYGCYQRMGCTACVAQDPADYARLAVRLANDDDYRAEMVREIEQTSPVLFEDQRAIEEHERIFAQLLGSVGPV